MKKVLWSGGVFFGLQLLHLICTILFLFLSSEPLTKAVWLSAILLASAIALIVTEALLSNAKQKGRLSDHELGQVYILKKTVSSVLGAAGANTLVYVVNVVFDMPMIVTGVLAIGFGLVCIVNLIAFLILNRSEPEEEEEEAMPAQAEE